MATHNRTTSDTAGGVQLGRLSELDDFKVADGYPDIRGWDVKTADGTKVGEVKDLVVDTGAMRARYVDVELDRSLRTLARDAATPGDQSDQRHVLLPIGPLQLDDARDDVRIDGYSAEQIAGLPRYDGGALTREYESSLRAGLPGGAAGAGAGLAAGGAGVAGASAAADRFDYDADAHRDMYDDQRLFAGRRRSVAPSAEQTTGAQRLTLAEEQLEVGKRRVQAGEVDVGKRVETEHVRESVPLVHDEVTIERRPLTPDAVTPQGISEDEVRVPLMAEEAVVQKRVVPREEIIVRKQVRQEERVVDAELRRERLDVDDATAVQEGGRSGGRFADAVDDVKDRVDGDPRSRPGPDATDRRV